MPPGFFKSRDREERPTGPLDFWGLRGRQLALEIGANRLATDADRALPDRARADLASLAQTVDGLDADAAEKLGGSWSVDEFGNRDHEAKVARPSRFRSLNSKLTGSGRAPPWLLISSGTRRKDLGAAGTNPASEMHTIGWILTVFSGFGLLVFYWRYRVGGIPLPWTVVLASSLASLGFGLYALSLR